MSFLQLTSGLHDFFRQASGAAANAKALFLTKKPVQIGGYEEKGEISAGLFIEHDKPSDGENQLYLRIPNTPENVDLYLNKSSLVVFHNYNHLYDRIIFSFSKAYEVSPDLSFIKFRLKQTPDKYPPEA